MKKFFWIMGFTFFSAILAVLAWFWYATAKGEMEVIRNNSIYLAQQLYLEHYQLSFDYDRLRIGSHFLQPKIVMTDPVLTFATDGEIYKLTASEVEFVGGIGSYDKYTIRLPETVMLVKDGTVPQVTGMTVESFPEVRVATSQTGEEKRIDSVILDQIRLGRGEKITLKLPGNGKESLLTYKPHEVLSAKWNTIRYQIYPYLSRFALTVEAHNRASDASK